MNDFAGSLARERPYYHGLPTIRRGGLMDAAYYEDLADRLYGLVIRLSGRLSRDQVQWLHHVSIETTITAVELRTPEGQSGT
jgi:hypothetical protein